MIKFGSALMDAVEQIEREKAISKDIILRSLCDAMVSAYKKQIHDKMATNVKAILYEKTGEIGIYREKVIVKTVEDENLEITLKDAKKLDPEAEIDKTVEDGIWQRTCPKCGKSHDIDYPKCPNCKHNYLE